MRKEPATDTELLIVGNGRTSSHRTSWKEIRYPATAAIGYCEPPNIKAGTEYVYYARAVSAPNY